LRFRRAIVRKLFLYTCCVVSLSSCEPASIRQDVPTSRVDANAARSDGPSEHSAAPRTRSDWPRLFGPAGDSSSPETWVNLDWPAPGPPLLWEAEIGRGYSAPVVAGDRLIVFHRLDDREIVSCRSAETGDELWRRDWRTDYRCDWRVRRTRPATR
jgi:hypothetical protein